MFDTMTIEQVVAIMFMLMMGGFAIITTWIMGEFNYFRKVIGVILAANPRIAKQVSEFTKKEENVMDKVEDGSIQQEKGRN